MLSYINKQTQPFMTELHIKVETFVSFQSRVIYLVIWRPNSTIKKAD
jgi:hypothetical protein